MADTLNLQNGTLTPGIALPTDGLGPVAITYDSARGELFVADGSGAVSVVSDSSDQVLATIPVLATSPVPWTPRALTYDPSRGDIYVAGTPCPENGGICDGTVAVVSDVSNTVVATIPVWENPVSLTYDSGLGEIFVANEFSGNVSVISTSSEKVVANISLAGTLPEPDGLAYDPANAEVFVADADPDTGQRQVDVISDSSNTVVTTIGLSVPSDALAYDSGTGQVFVSEYGNVSVLSAASNRVVANVSDPTSGGGIAYDPSVSRVYVTGDDSNLSVISDATDTVVANLSVGSYARAVAIDPRVSEVLVASQESSNLTVIEDTSDRVVGDIVIGNSPYAVAFDSGASELFVTEYYSSSVTIVSTLTDRLVANVTVGIEPDAVVYDGGRGEIFVTNLGSNNVTVIANGTDQVVANISVGEGPDGLAYDNATSQVFVANGGSNNVSVISDLTNSVVAAIPVGSQPLGVVYDSDRLEVFVANSGSKNLSIISGTTDVGVGNLSIPNGTDELAYDSAQGEIFVSGNGIVSTIISDRTNASVASIEPLYQSYTTSAAYDPSDGSFIASGNRFCGGSYAGTVAAISDTTYMQNGSTLVGCDPTSVAYDPSNELLYVANAGQGTVSIVSTESPCVQACFAVTVNVTGFPPASFHSDWYFNVTGEPWLASNSSSAAVDLPNGTYHFTVNSTFEVLYSGYTISPTNGTFRVAGGPLTISVRFALRVTYTVVFFQSGLPAGISWTVTDNLTGYPFQSRNTSDTNELTLSLVNGNYSYQVEGPPYYNITPKAGTLTIEGANQSISIEFSSAPFEARFHETGLPAGTIWYANVTNRPSGESNSSAFNESLGGGVYTVRYASSNREYRPTPTSVEFSVDGSDVFEYVDFTEVTYALLIDETGLPAGTNWTIALNGVALNSVEPTISTMEPNGTYSFTVLPVKGYAANLTSGSFTIDGGTGTLEIAFASTNGTPPPHPSGRGTFLGLPPDLVYSLVAALVLALLAAGVILARRKRGSPPLPEPPSRGAPPETNSTVRSDEAPNAKAWNWPK